jgi:hypothetical protein
MGIRRISPGRMAEDAYTQGRFSHDGKRYVGFVDETQAEISTPKWETDATRNNPEPQRREDQRAPGYDNNTAEKWLTGRGKVHPHFDSDPAGEPTRKK